MGITYKHSRYSQLIMKIEMSRAALVLKLLITDQTIKATPPARPLSSN
jgi:hypothetical protein